ncbi:hypothetical protein U9M48_009321 [Paspalum notatum var. saurae]|uniref:WRC domain-containing protein n=1 Tax=Paspalum notatum var. saurae TaxID=547442 RepID=A0AAQ3WEW2_PASNO
MRIRKRTPARAASPGLSAPPPLQQQPNKEKPEPQDDKEEEEEEEEEPEEKRVILIAGALVDPVPVAAAPENMTDGATPKPDPQDAAAARCSRNDGKRWRCKSAAAPGYLFCARHVAWSTRKRKPRPATTKKKLRSRGGGGAEDEMARLGRDAGGFADQLPGKRAKDGGVKAAPHPAALP